MPGGNEMREMTGLVKGSGLPCVYRAGALNGSGPVWKRSRRGKVMRSVPKRSFETDAGCVSRQQTTGRSLVAVVCCISLRFPIEPLGAFVVATPVLLVTVGETVESPGGKRVFRSEGGGEATASLRSNVPPSRGRRQVIPRRFRLPTQKSSNIGWLHELSSTSRTASAGQMPSVPFGDAESIAPMRLSAISTRPTVLASERASVIQAFSALESTVPSSPVPGSRSQRLNSR